jgi:hypothetical protein
MARRLRWAGDMKTLAIVSLLLVGAPAFAQEAAAPDDFCKACVDPDAPPPASAATDEELRAAEHERRAAEYAEKRRHIGHLKLAGGVLLGVGTAIMPVALVLGFVTITNGIGSIGCGFTNDYCPSPSNAPYYATIGLFAIGAPMVISGITLLAVAGHEKKRLGPPDPFMEPARDLVSSLGVSPISTNGTTTGGVLQWNLSF